MQRETLWHHVREVWQASSILLQKEGEKLNSQQHDSVLSIFLGITRLRKALMEADQIHQQNEAPLNGEAPDWNHLMLSPLTSVRGYSKLLLDGAFGQLSSKQALLVSTIHRHSQPISDLIDELYLGAHETSRQFALR